MAVGSAPDRPGHIVRDPVGDEVGEPLARLVDDADGGVPGMGELGRGRTDAVQGGVQLQPRADRTHRLQELRDPGGELGGEALQAAGGLGGGIE